MKVVILAGGRGTRLAEETEVKPKPMVEIGGRPILWHIMKHYAHYGFSEFFVALGYRGEVIKRWFVERQQIAGDLSVHLGKGTIDRTATEDEDWHVHLVETGAETNTGGRVKRLAPQLSDATFMVTYGDGVSDIALDKLLAFHKSKGKLATVTAVRPPARFGALVMEGDLVARFTEKPQAGESWINGGYLVLEPGVLRYLSGDQASLEMETLSRLASDGQLAAYRHDGFWQCMDTVRDLQLLQGYWVSGQAPWKVWP